MKKFTIILAFLAILISLASVFYPKSNNHQVYVDVNILLDGYKRTELVRSEFDKKAKTLNANIDSLMTDWQNELKKYEKERSSMSEKELELQQQLLSNKQQQINNYQQAVKKQIQDEDEKATQTVVNDINDYVKEYGGNNGYDIIFGANGGGNIMFASDRSDLTQDVLIGLNAEYEGK